MAVQTWTAPTAGSSLNIFWKKSQGKLVYGFNAKCEEMGWVKKIKPLKINISAREITIPIDIKKRGSAALIPEGGYEAVPRSKNLSELTVTWSNYNDRWATTLTAHYLAGLGQDNQVTDQFKFQAKQSVERIANTVGRDFYGLSSGVMALTSTNATASSGQAYTLIDAFGQSGIDSAAYLGAIFNTEDRVGLVRSGSLVTNGIGQITAVTPATPSITVTWLGSVDADANDEIVFANNIENATLAGGTSYNKALTGLLDISTSASLHNLATSAEPAWAANAFTTTQRYSSVVLRKMKQSVANNGGGDIDTIIWSNGVSNDVFDSQSALLRFTDAANMELDGDTPAKGIAFRTSRRVPPKHVFAFDSSAIQKFNLVEAPTEGGTVWGDGDKVEGKNEMAFSIDFPMALVCTNRANISYGNDFTEQ